MLQTLKIKNVALIKDIEINFQNGFNVLIGETGAGKSIIFDALNFVLGAKADKTLLRSGEQVMRVDAVFSALSNEATNALKDLGLMEDGESEIALTRTFDAEGKSTARINGFPSSTPLLKACGEILLDSFSQHEGLQLLKSKNHIAMLDRLGGENISQIKEKLAEEFSEYQEINKKIKALGGDEFERERTKELLSYQIKEIESAELEIGEDEVLKEKMALLSSGEKIFEAVNECESLLENSSMSAVSSVHEAASQLSGLLGIETIDACHSRLNSVKYELQDIIETLKDIRDKTNFDERELERLDRRHDQIKLLCKKYGANIESVLNFLENARLRFDELENSEATLAKLENEKSRKEKALEKLCESLSVERKKIAESVEKKIVEELRALGMKNTHFVVKFERLANFTSAGYDEVEFTFSANVGQEVKALAKTASGGEMSRVMLAFKTIFAEVGLAQTLVFDEVDAGVSGEIGYEVGRKLVGLSKTAQVLCVTHLAQVASQGDAFYFVSKSTDGKSTFTSVKQLQGDEISYELARLLGGDNVTDVALAHIQEMRERKA